MENDKGGGSSRGPKDSFGESLRDTPALRIITQISQII
jgi:hypothetical protein